MIAADEHRRHEEVWLILPWLATGRLSAAQCELAEAHLRHCEDCRRELVLQERLCTAFTEPDRVTYAPGPSFRKLMERIDRAPAGRSTPQRAQQAGRSLLARLGSVSSWRPPGLAWAASFLLIFTVSGLVATAFRWGVPEHVYTTRTDGSAEPSKVLHIALDRSLTLGDVEELLRTNGARIVEGPGNTGVFGVRPTGDVSSAPSEARALKALAARLRSDPRVLWVQPLPDDTKPAEERAPETQEH